MAEATGGSGQASSGAVAASDPDARICLASHPLLGDVRCQRLLGHPGAHGAEVETSSAEIYLEWSDDGPAEG